jgi:Na+/H+-translocating membrane pyrophosphatase
MESLAIYMPIILALIGLAYMLYKKSWVMKQDAGDGKMKEISDHIYEGALAFLNAEYKLLAVFVFVVSLALAGVSVVVPTTHWLIVIAFIFGAVFSAWAGNMGMKIATKTNVRTTQAARTSLPNALKNIIWWRNSYGTWSCRTCSIRSNSLFYNILSCFYGRFLDKYRRHDNCFRNLSRIFTRC